MESELVKTIQQLMESHRSIYELRPLGDIVDTESDSEGLTGLVGSLGLESYAAGLEVRGGLTNFLKRVTKSFSESAWDAFIDSLDNSRSQAENKLNRIKYLKSKMAKAENLGGHGAVVYQSQYEKLQINGKIPDVRTLLDLASVFEEIVSVELTDEMDFVLRIGSKLVSEIESMISLTERTAESRDLALLLGRIGDLGDVAVTRRDGLSYLSRTMDEAGRSVYQSRELPGNLRVTSTVAQYDKATLRSVGLPLFQSVAGVFSMRTELRYGYTGRSDDSLPKMSEAEIAKALRVCENICNSIIRFKIRHGTNFSRSKRQFSVLRDKLDRVGRGGENIDHKLYLRKAADASHATARWIHTPAMPLIGHALRVTTALMAYANASIDSSAQA